MTKILAFAGKKQSGKSSSANFVLGCVLSNMGLTPKFKISDTGDLLIPYWDENGNEFLGPYDIYSDTEINRTEVWPHIKIYNFAEALKRIAIDLFDLPAELVYGTDEDKNTLTHLKSLDGTKYLTIREFLQDFGSDICRKYYPEVWVNKCLKQISQDNPKIALIGDCRFPNEVCGIKIHNGIVIKLTKSTSSKDSHNSETALDINNFDHDIFDEIIENNDYSLDQKNQHIFNYLTQIEWLTGQLVNQEKSC